MTGISGIYTALSGMHAHRRVIDATSHNIANQTTPGFHRRRVELSPAGIPAAPGVFSGSAQHLRGVDVDGITRIIDTVAEGRNLREASARAGTQTTAAALDRIELVFAEPSDNGIGAHLDRFWNGWTDVSNHPDDLAVRTQLLDHSQGLADALRRASTDLDTIAADARGQVTRVVADVNDVAARVADLNAAIAASVETPNDLLDERDLLVHRLGELAGATVRPGDRGQVNVYIGDRALVLGTNTQRIDGTGGVAQWQSDSSPVAGGPSQLTSLQATIDDLVPRHRAALDGVAAALVADVNALHSTGYDLAGTTGHDFFDPAGVTAATIGLHADIAGQPGNVAAGAPVLPGPTAPGPLDGELARGLAALADSTTGADSEYRSLVANIGVETRDAFRRDMIQEQVAMAAAADADAAGGVSLDEEMATLMAAQRGYEASARVLTVVDEMLGTLMRTGVVGR